MSNDHLRVTHSRCLHCGEEYAGRPWRCLNCFEQGDDPHMMERLHRTTTPLGLDDDDDFEVHPLGGGEPYYEYPVMEDA